MAKAVATTIDAYIHNLPTALAAVCTALRKGIEHTIPTAKGKVWHGAPVWFLGEHPVVGTSLKAKKHISLLFWNGQAFNEPSLKAVGKFKAAEALFEQTAQIDEAMLVRQLKKSATMLWDYRGVVRKPKTTPDVEQARKSASTKLATKPKASKPKPDKVPLPAKRALPATR